MGRTTDISGAASTTGAITPSDSDDIAGGVLRGFTVGAAGDVAVIYQDGTTAVLPQRQVGADYAHQIKRILATGTTATGIIGYR